jgi:cytochrome c553
MPVEVRGISHLAKNERDTPISCSLRWTMPRVRLSLKERRMKFAEPNNLHRKSGVWGTRSSVVEYRLGKFASFLGLVLVSGCHQLAPSKPLNELSPQEAAGHQIFVSQCSSCHYANTEKGLNGPGLEGLFRKPYLPSGGAANDARVTAVITRGRNMMPALGNTLSDQQLEDLMAYLHTL